MDPARLAIMRVEIIASWRRLENLRSIDQAAVPRAITQVAIIAYNLDKKWSDFFQRHSLWLASNLLSLNQIILYNIQPTYRSGYLQPAKRIPGDFDERPIC